MLSAIRKRKIMSIIDYLKKGNEKHFSELDEAYNNGLMLAIKLKYYDISYILTLYGKFDYSQRDAVNRGVLDLIGKEYGYEVLRDIISERCEPDSGTERSGTAEASSSSALYNDPYPNHVNVFKFIRNCELPYKGKKLIGSGTYGKVYHDVENNQVIKRYLFDGAPEVGIHYNFKDDIYTFEPDTTAISEFLVVKRITAPLAAPQAVAVNTACDTARYTDFITDILDITFNKNFYTVMNYYPKTISTLSETSENIPTIDCCFKLIIFVIHELQHHFKFMHNDLKSCNILLEPIENTRFANKKNIEIILSSGGGRGSSAEKIKIPLKNVKYLPRISDWGMSCIYKKPEIVLESVVNKDVYVPHEFNENFDLVFLWNWLYKQCEFAKKSDFLQKVGDWLYEDRPKKINSNMWKINDLEKFKNKTPKSFFENKEIFK